MTQAASVQNGIRGWHVLFGMIAFFVIVTAVNSVMIYKALATFSGETPDAYRSGLDYNQRIAEARTQAKLGWTEATKFDASTGTFTVTLKDRDGHGVDGLQVTAAVGRLATDVADHDFTLTPGGNGSYSVVIPNLAEGAWEVAWAASKGQGRDRDIVYRSKGSLWKQP